jgi:hypothetical protein
LKPYRLAPPWPGLGCRAKDTKFMSRLRLALFTEATAAELIRRRLAQAGIPAEIHSEPALAKLWFVSRRSAGVRLEVPAHLSERARQLLVEWDAREACLRKAIRCPDCKSLRVDYPQFTQKSLFTNVAMGLLAELRLVEREYYCEDCHCMWPKPGHRAGHIRRHMAPNYFIEGAEPETLAMPHSPKRGARR